MSDYDHLEGFKQQDKTYQFLLPSGMLIQLQCKDADTIFSTIEKLWDESKQFHFLGLQQPEKYTLSFINCQAIQQEWLDESVKIGELPMYKPIFKVVK